MYFKIVKENTIVDAMDKLSFVRQNPKNKAIISSQTDYANGIISSDGTVIWHLEGLPAFASGSFDTVVAIEISKEEYDRLVEQLQLGQPIENPETVREPLSTTEMMEKLEELTTKVQELEEKNASLELELSKLTK